MMRANDTLEEGVSFKRARWTKTVFGFLLAIAGIAAFFILKDHDIRTDVGIAGAILIGGMYIDSNVMTSTVKLFTPFFPWKKAD